MSSSVNTLDALLAGGVSGVATRLLVSPLDVLKIRLQLQSKDPSHPASKYRGLRHAFCCILREEGPGGFWKGLLAGQALYLVYSSAQFSSFELLKRTLSTFTEGHSKPLDSWWHFPMGFVSGCLATTISYPLDCMRTRLVSQGEPKVYRGMTHAFKAMIKEGGARTFYKGIFPTLLQIGPLAGLQFGLYNTLKMATPLQLQDNTAVQLVWGASAGVTSKMIMLPFDLVKKRMQVQGFTEAHAVFGSVPVYRGTLHCVSTVLAQEGGRAFYKGSAPALLKATLSVSASFWIYEQTKAILAARHST